MNKKILCIILLCLAFSAHAEGQKTYLKAEAGISLATPFSAENYDKKRPKNSVVFNLGMGHKVNDELSADINYYSFPHHDFSKVVKGDAIKQKIKSNVIMFNAHYDIMAHHELTPFVTVGAGYAQNDAGDYITPNFTVHGKSQGNMAWNLGAGIKGNITKKLKLALTYRFFNLGKIESSPLATIDPSSPAVTTTQAIKTKLRAHTIMVGLSYYFG